MGLSHAPRVITDGIVLGLDAANTRSYVGSGTTWTDLIGSNNGTLLGGTYHTDGPFVGAGYVEFDGTGDYLSIADDASLQLGSGDFTIEFWIYLNSLSGNPTPIDKAYTGSGVSGVGYLLQYSSSALKFYGGITLTSSTTDTTSVWIHYALVRNSGTTTLYRNGVSVASGSDNTNYTYNTSLGIGANILAGAGFGAEAGAINGYISNFRIIKGTALYTSNFTPPTKPLTAVPNTVLLTCQGNAISDASSSGHTITANGTAAANLGFPKSSFVFDGTNDYVGAPVYIPTEDASIEVWARIDIFEGNVLFGFGGDDYPGGFAGSGPDVYISGGTWAWNTGDGVTNAFSANPTVNTTDWFHYVVTTESASNAKLYVNGNLIGTANHKSARVTNSGDRVIIGRWGNLTGYETPGNYGIVRVYDRVLSLSEIQQNYNATKGRYA